MQHIQGVFGREDASYDDGVSAGTGTHESSMIVVVDWQYICTGYKGALALSDRVRIVTSNLGLVDARIAVNTWSARWPELPATTILEKGMIDS
jgi:hypothetical protein